ncbi:hypothetical protein PZA11_002992 [Diplocarpon coronariae]
MSEYPGLPPLAYFMHLLQASHLCYMVPVVLFFSITIGLQDAQGFGRNVTNKLSLLLTLVCVWALALVGEFITLRWLGQLLFWSATLTLDDQDSAAKLLRSVEVLLLVLAVLVVFTGWLVTIAVGCEKIRELWRELRSEQGDVDLEAQVEDGECEYQYSSTWQSEWKSEWIDHRCG